MICCKCEEDKSKEHYYGERTYHGKARADNICKECHKEAARLWQKENRLRWMFLVAKNRAKRKGLSFSITMNYLEQLWLEQAGKCALSGLSFCNERKSPYVASLDRVDNKKGYIKGNVRFILTALNKALNEYGLDIYTEIAEAVLKNQ